MLQHFFTCSIVKPKALESNLYYKSKFPQCSIEFQLKIIVIIILSWALFENLELLKTCQVTQWMLYTLWQKSEWWYVSPRSYVDRCCQGKTFSKVGSLHKHIRNGVEISSRGP